MLYYKSLALRDWLPKSQCLQWEEKKKIVSHLRTFQWNIPLSNWWRVMNVGYWALWWNSLFISPLVRSSNGCTVLSVNWCTVTVVTLEERVLFHEQLVSSRTDTVYVLDWFHGMCYLLTMLVISNEVFLFSFHSLQFLSRMLMDLVALIFLHNHLLKNKHEIQKLVKFAK